VPAPQDDAIEIDELCIRVSASLWLWTAVSRKVRQVVGFVIGERTDPMLRLVWSDVPADYRDKPVYSDYLGAYARFFPEAPHHPCEKGSGLTSLVEGLNTKWRQRHAQRAPGLVRHACGVHRKREDDIIERFFLLIEEHNQQAAKQWERQQNQASIATPSSP
jgi:IS1 family transposase